MNIFSHSFTLISVVVGITAGGAVFFLLLILVLALSCKCCCNNGSQKQKYKR